MVTIRIPYLRAPCFVDRGRVRFAHSERQGLAPAEIELVEAVFQGGATVEELAQRLVARGAGDDCEAVTSRLMSAFAASDHVIGVVELEVPDAVDVMLVEQGYGGVYVHSVELLKRLRSRWRCLLLSPTEPLFEPEPLGDVMTLAALKKRYPELGYFAWIQVVRTLVARTKCRLLLLMHRSQSLYLFDLLRDRKAVIYCDGYYDGAFRRVRDFHLDETEASRREVLAEVYYVLANGNQEFYGFNAAPSVNVRVLMAGSYSLFAAAENWCWGKEQRDHFADSFPAIADRIRLMLPFTDPAMFRPDLVERERRVLFTTTMHNIHRKGLPELVAALKRLPDVRVRCVVRQPQHLPPIPASVARRMQVGSVTKDEMVRLYHRLWVNCRTSRDESSPVSILESMACELPQIVSPTVANQIPLIEDGVTGFVVDPDDQERLAWALRTLLGDRRLRDRMGRECRRRTATLAFEHRVGEFERLLA